MKYLVTWKEDHRVEVEADTHLKALQEAIDGRNDSYNKTKTCISAQEIACKALGSGESKPEAPIA